MMETKVKIIEWSKAKIWIWRPRAKMKRDKGKK